MISSTRTSVEQYRTEDKEWRLQQDLARKERPEPDHRLSSRVAYQRVIGGLKP
jgi:hypothetical protein